jgi:hypothetical protein
MPANRILYSTTADRLFAITGRVLYEIYKDGTYVERGSLGTVYGPATIAENDTQLIISDGRDGWLFDLRTDVLSKIENLQDMVETVSRGSGGTGYHVGDILTLTKSGTVGLATVQVLSVTDGVIDELGIALMDGGRGYTQATYPTTGGLGSGATINVETLRDNGFVASPQIVNIDGFFIARRPSTGEFCWSYLRDGSTWDPLSYATAEGSPDALLAINKVNNELWLFGKKTTEIWYDTGDADSQFQRVQQGFIDVGIAAPDSSAVLGNQIFWLGADSQGSGVVWSAINYMPKRISTHAIEYVIAKIAKESGIADAAGYCYQQEGHFFYVLNFSAGQRTLVYDASTEMWHERGYWVPSKHQMQRHIGSKAVSCWGKILIGDYRNANIYEMSLDAYTDNGNLIRRIRTGPHIRSDRKRLFFHEFEADVQRGVGLEVAADEVPGNDPQLLLTQSEDGGLTFGNERRLNIGRVGQNLIRAHCHRLGYSRDRVFRLTISDPVKTVLLGARCDITAEG